jgi:hypothetical protein
MCWTKIFKAETGASRSAGEASTDDGPMEVVMATVLDKYIAAYRRLPSPKNRARLMFNLSKWYGSIKLLNDADLQFLATHEFISNSKNWR